MQPQIKYNRQASLKVTSTLSWENNITLEPGRVCKWELLTGLKHLQHKFVFSTFQHQLGLRESILSAAC